MVIIVSYADMEFNATIRSMRELFWWSCWRVRSSAPGREARTFCKTMLQTFCLCSLSVFGTMFTAGKRKTTEKFLEILWKISSPCAAVVDDRYTVHHPIWVWMTFQHIRKAITVARVCNVGTERIVNKVYPHQFFNSFLKFGWQFSVVVHVHVVDVI